LVENTTSLSINDTIELGKDKNLTEKRFSDTDLEVKVRKHHSLNLLNPVCGKSSEYPIPDGFSDEQQFNVIDKA